MPLMQIQCDVTRLLKRHRDGIPLTGIDRVTLHYAKWALNLGGGLVVQSALRLRTLSPDLANLLVTGEPMRPDLIQIPRNRTGRKLRRALATLSQLAGKAPPPKAGAAVLNTAHSWLERDELLRWLTQRGNRLLIFIHDLIPIEFPEYARPVEKTRHVKRINNALKYGKGIAVNSEYTRESLAEHAKKEGLPMPPTVVAPLGHTLEFAHCEPPAEYNTPYFLILGTIEPRKNHLLVLTVWRELVRRLGPATPRLIVVGRRGWECEQIIDLLERCEAIHPYVTELNQASDELVAGLIRGARALLMPSFAEGFGMPVQEALAAGTPVIASPLPAFIEVAGEIPDYAEPLDGIRWLHLIMDHMEPKSICRAHQLERMQGFRESTWEAHFEKFEAFVHSMK